MAEKFQKILGQVVCFGPISFNILLAKETGILDILLKAEKPLTSAEIGKECKVIERYVREMLGCLSAVELVRASKNQDGVYVYDLEAPAKEVLPEAMTQMVFVKILMKKYEDVKNVIGDDKSGVLRYDDSFYNPWDEYKRYRTQPTIDCILKNTEGLREKLENGIEVVEFGCGSAYDLSVLATMFPNSTFTATEVREKLIDKIKDNYSEIPNLKFEIMDLLKLPEKKFDWLLINDVLHDLPSPLEGLKGIRKMMRDSDSVFTFIDFAGTGCHQKDAGDHMAGLLYALATFLCIPESYQRADTEAHGASWGKETALNIAKEAGLETKFVPMDGKAGLFVCRPN